MFDLIDAVIEWAEEEDAKGPMSAWDQEIWGVEKSCGTAYCIAGKVAANAGWRPADGSFSMLEKDGVYELTSCVATEILGIDHEDAEYLFNAENSLKELKEIRDAIARRNGHPTKWSRK